MHLIFFQKAPIVWSCEHETSSFGIFVNDIRVLIGSEDGLGKSKLISDGEIYSGAELTS